MQGGVTVQGRVSILPAKREGMRTMVTSVSLWLSLCK